MLMQIEVLRAEAQRLEDLQRDLMRERLAAIDLPCRVVLEPEDVEPIVARIEQACQQLLAQCEEAEDAG